MGGEPGAINAENVAGHTTAVAAGKELFGGKGMEYAGGRVPPLPQALAVIGAAAILYGVFNFARNMLNRKTNNN
jgi:hypothetical protein